MLATSLNVSILLYQNHPEKVLAPLQSDYDKWIPAFYRGFVYQNHSEKVLVPIQPDSDKWIPLFYRGFVYQNHHEKVLVLSPISWNNLPKSP